MSMASSDDTCSTPATGEATRVPFSHPAGRWCESASLHTLTLRANVLATSRIPLCPLVGRHSSHSPGVHVAPRRLPRPLTVDQARVQVARDEAGTDALDLVGSGATAGYDGGLSGLDGDDLDVGVLLLEVLAGPGDGATRAHASDEDVDLAPCLGPELGAGRLVVDLWVSGVLELHWWG